MASSMVEIWNMALSHIGVKNFVTGPNEKSQEAAVLSIWWLPSLDYVLADHPWPFAGKYAQLGLVETVNPEWAYAYRYPSDCVHVRRICDPVGGRASPNPPPFVIGHDDDGKVIYTDQADAILYYTVRVNEPERFDAKCVEALSIYLASRIANPLTRMPNLGKDLEDSYNRMIVKAAVKSSNEMQQDDPQEAEWIRARA